MSISAGKTTAKFVKRLLKEPAHRNNVAYWSLYSHFAEDNILEKLLATPLRLENQVMKISNEHLIPF